MMSPVGILQRDARGGLRLNCHINRGREWTIVFVAQFDQTAQRECGAGPERVCGMGGRDPRLPAAALDAVIKSHRVEPAITIRGVG